MNSITFYKLQASGNDFIILDQRLQALSRRPKNKKEKINYVEFAKIYCDRRLGIGADGILVLAPSKKADFKMRIFNPDGSEAEMCGNGARCAAVHYIKSQGARVKGQVKIKFETIAGIIEAEVKGNAVKIKITDPVDLKLDFPIEISNRKIRANFINTGVPHVVIFVENVDVIDAGSIGSQIRYHNFFAPYGANVNFVQIEDNNTISIRTYERGVEAETLACGTGSVASAIISAVSNRLTALKNIIEVKTKGAQILKVYFDSKKNCISNVWLEGKAQSVFEGNLRV